MLVTTWNLDDALAARRPAASHPRRSRAAALSPARSRAPRQVRPWPDRTPSCWSPSGRWIGHRSGALYSWSGEGRRVGLGERPRWFAHDACAFLARPDLPERIAAYNISQAAVCIAHSAPQHKQFMVPGWRSTRKRPSNATWRRSGDCGTTTQLGKRPGDRLRPARRIPALLIERGTLGRAAEILSHDSRWRCVFADPMATVFVATRFAEQHHLPAVPLH